MDAASAAANIFTLIEISVKVTRLCVEYYSHVKSAQNNIYQLHLEVKAIIKVLQNLHQLA